MSQKITNHSFSKFFMRYLRYYSSEVLIVLIKFYFLCKKGGIVKRYILNATSEDNTLRYDISTHLIAYNFHKNKYIVNFFYQNTRY